MPLGEQEIRRIERAVCEAMNDTAAGRCSIETGADGETRVFVEGDREKYVVREYDGRTGYGLEIGKEDSNMVKLPFRRFSMSDEESFARFRSAYDTGHGHAADGEELEALVMFGRAHEFAPVAKYRALSSLMIGALYMKMGELSAALTYFSNAIAEDRLFADAYNALALVFMKRRDYESAVDSLLEAIAIDGSNPLYHMNLFEAYRSLGMEKEAAISALTAFGLVPGTEGDQSGNAGVRARELAAAVSGLKARILRAEAGKLIPGYSAMRAPVTEERT